MLEINRKDKVLKFFNVLDEERCASRSPGNDMGILLVFKNVIGFVYKVAD